MLGLVLLDNGLILGGHVRFDAQDDPVIGYVHSGGLQWDLVALGERVGRFLQVVHAELRYRNEALKIAAQVHNHALLQKPHDLAGTNGVLVVLLRDDRPRILAHLLESQGHPAGVLVHAQNDHLYGVALLQHLRGMAYPARPRHVGDVHETIYPLLELYEGPEVRQVADLAGDARSHGIALLQGQPRIGLDLLQAQRYLLVLFVHLENHGLYGVADRQHLGRMPDMLGPRHLGDVNQSFDALLELYEGAVVGYADDPAFDPVADRVLLIDVLPRVPGELLQPERYPLALLVEVQHLHRNLVADRDHLRRMAYPAPGHVGYVQQAVDAAQIHERPEIGDVFDHALAYLVLGQLGQHLRFHLLPLFLEHRAAGYDYVAPPLVQLDDLESHGPAQKLVHVLDLAQGDLGSRQEGLHAEQIHDHSALYLPQQPALHDRACIRRVLDAVPDLDEVGSLLRKHHETVLVLHLLQEHIHFVSYLDALGVAELLYGYHALRLETHVHEDFLLIDLEDRAFDDLPFLEVHHRFLVELHQLGVDLRVGVRLFGKVGFRHRGGLRGGFLPHGFGSLLGALDLLIFGSLSWFLRLLPLVSFVIFQHRLNSPSLLILRGFDCRLGCEIRFRRTRGRRPAIRLILKSFRQTGGARSDQKGAVN